MTSSRRAALERELAAVTNVLENVLPQKDERIDALVARTTTLHEQLERAIIWVQHDCPFTREQILECINTEIEEAKIEKAT